MSHINEKPEMDPLTKLSLTASNVRFKTYYSHSPPNYKTLRYDIISQGFTSEYVEDMVAKLHGVTPRICRLTATVLLSFLARSAYITYSPGFASIFRHTLLTSSGFDLNLAVTNTPTYQGGVTVYFLFQPFWIFCDSRFVILQVYLIIET